MSCQPKNDRVDEFLTLLAGCDRRLYAYILSLVPNFHDADDIAQECRSLLWQQFETYQSGTNFEGWARTIAHFLVLKHREKSGRCRLRFNVELLDTLSQEFASAAEVFESRQSVLLECLATVSDNTRQLLQLVFAQGLSVKVAAQRLQKPIEGTYKALSRARRSLHDCVERKLAGRQS